MENGKLDAKKVFDENISKIKNRFLDQN